MGLCRPQPWSEKLLFCSEQWVTQIIIAVESAKHKRLLMHASQRVIHITSSHKSRGTAQRTVKKMMTRDGGWRGVLWTAVFRTIKPQHLWLSEQDLIEPTRNNSTVDKSDSKGLALSEELFTWHCSNGSSFSLGVQQPVRCPCSSGGPEARVHIHSSNQTQWVKKWRKRNRRRGKRKKQRT